MEPILAHQPTATACPVWCKGGHQPAEPHAGMMDLDEHTSLVLTTAGPDGTLTAEILGEPSPTAAEGSVLLTMDAITRLAAILPGLSDEGFDEPGENR